MMVNMAKKSKYYIFQDYPKGIKLVFRIPAYTLTSNNLNFKINLKRFNK